MPFLRTDENLKKAYNYCLNRFDKAERYFKRCSKANLERWLPQYIEIINDMGILLEELEKRGITITSEDIEKGFKEYY